MGFSLIGTQNQLSEDWENYAGIRKQDGHNNTEPKTKKKIN